MAVHPSGRAHNVHRREVISEPLCAYIEHVSEPFTHDPHCAHITRHSDGAKRCSDVVNMHLAVLGFGAHRQWVAIRLSDGGSDGVLYAARRDAVRHQLDESQCAYVCVPPTQMSVCSAEAFLAFHRKAYASGFRLTDPDHHTGGLDHVRRLTRRDQSCQLSRLPR